MTDWKQAEVLENHRWTEDLYSLRFAVDLPDFIPGQFVRLALDVEGERLARPYSLVNAPGESVAEVHYNPVPDGPLSPRLAALKPGDSLWVANRIAGFLILDEVPQAHHLWLLATGTGVGPFVSILKGTEVFERFERVVLVHSVRTEAELGYRGLLEGLAVRHAGRLSYLPAVTREQVPGMFERRIPHVLADGSLEQAAGMALRAEDAHVMLCGSNAMIKDVSELLGQRGMQRHLRHKPGHITLEKYH